VEGNGVEIHKNGEYQHRGWLQLQHIVAMARSNICSPTSALHFSRERN
jgi:hypothetical protein